MYVYIHIYVYYVYVYTHRLGVRGHGRIHPRGPSETSRFSSTTTPPELKLVDVWHHIHAIFPCSNSGRKLSRLTSKSQQVPKPLPLAGWLRCGS